MQSKVINTKDKEKLISEYQYLIKNNYLNENQFFKIAAACQTTTQVSTIFHLIESHESTGTSIISAYKLLSENIDASPYPLQDWIVSIEFLVEWLAIKKRSTTLGNAISYLSCCVESGTLRNIKSSLVNLLDEMLSNYGYDS